VAGKKYVWSDKPASSSGEGGGFFGGPLEPKDPVPDGYKWFIVPKPK
jgi:hypothetical protein